MIGCENKIRIKRRKNCSSRAKARSELPGENEKRGPEGKISRDDATTTDGGGCAHDYIKSTISELMKLIIRFSLISTGRE